jgi:hypothetical protein
LRSPGRFAGSACNVNNDNLNDNNWNNNRVSAVGGVRPALPRCEKHDPKRDGRCERERTQVPGLKGPKMRAAWAMPGGLRRAGRRLRDERYSQRGRPRSTSG